MSSAGGATVAPPFLSAVWHDFTTGLREAPAAAQRRLVMRLFGGILVLLALVAGVARLLAINFGDGLLPGDSAAAATIQALVSIRYADSVTVLGASILLIPVALVAAALAIRRGRPERGLIMITTFVVGKALTKTGWTFWDRTRPDGVADGLFVPPVPTFPSGHALQAVVIWGLLAGWWVVASRSTLERALVVFGATLVIVASGLTRVRLAQHHATDVLAAWVFGAVWVAVALWAERGFHTVGART